MERTLNKVEIKGFVGTTPRIIKLENGVQIVKFAVATHEAFKGKDGQYAEEVVWHNVVAYPSKNMPDFLTMKKGSFVEIKGKLEYSKYDDKNGNTHDVVEIVALKMIAHNNKENESAS